MSRRCETKQGRKRDQVCEEHRPESAVENLTERAKARQTVDALLSTSVDNLASPLYVRQTKHRAVGHINTHRRSAVHHTEGKLFNATGTPALDVRSICFCIGS